MATRGGTWQSNNDHEFILRSLRSGRRVDGRKLGDMRALRMVFARAEGQASAEIQLGRTRVLAVVTGEVCVVMRAAWVSRCASETVKEWMEASFALLVLLWCSVKGLEVSS